MIRDFLNSAIQKKYFVMFFTSVIYIVGLFAYFKDFAVEGSFVLLIIGIFAIVKKYLSPKLVLFWYLLFFFAFFNASLRIKNSDALYQLAPQDVVLQGQITSIPSTNKGDKTKFFFDVSKVTQGTKVQSVKAKTYVTVYSNDITASKFNIGDTYKISGKLRTPFKVSNPSQFDYGKYLRNFNAFTVFYADKKGCELVPQKLTAKWKFLQGINNVRNEIITTHSKYLKSPNLEILGGIVFGDDAVSPPDYIKASFMNSGLLHILAASGMNVALIYGIWFFILRRLKVPFNATVLSGIFVIIFYALMTGLGPSVIRAMLMLIFILAGKLMDRDAHSISLLSFVALLMLIYNPAYINDVGFQLSFMVTFGLLITAPVVFEHLTKIPKCPNWLTGAIFIPIVAQIWVAPIQMFYFNSFSLYSVFANIATMPFLTVLSFGGFVSSVLALIKPISSGVCYLFDLVLNPVLSCLVAISDYFSTLPHSLLQTTQPSLFQIFLYYGIALCVTLILKFGQMSKKIIVSMSVFALILLITIIPHPNKNLETIAFDMQNADAFLIKTPENKYFLIDSGKVGYKGAKSQASAVVLEYLKDKGIENIEGFIITHFDSDHAGGAVDLIQKLNIKNVYVNSLDHKSKIAKNIYKTVKAKKNLKLVKNNENVYSENGTNIQVFTLGLKGEDYDNESSIVTLVSNKNFDELLMGDAGVFAFERIKKYLPKNVEVLKIGHHGAKNVVDRKMLDRLKPQIAVISTGQNNYGHPNGVTLELLRSHKVKTFRTDKQNSVKIDFDGTSYNVNSYNKYKNNYALKVEKVKPL
jgi:competence protein ComEC